MNIAFGQYADFAALEHAARTHVSQGAKLLPLFVKIPAPAGTAAQLFAGLVRDNGGEQAFFFKTQASQGRGPVSILALDPAETLTIVDGRVSVNGHAVSGEAVDVLSAKLRNFHTARDAALPFFSGGLLGYFAYDFVRQLEPRLKNFGYFRELRNAVDGEFKLYTRVLVLDEASRELFLIAGVSLEGDLAAEAAAAAASLQNMQERVSQAPQETVTPAKIAAELPFEAAERILGEALYVKECAGLQEQIAAGEIFQGVLADRFRIPKRVATLDLFLTLSRLSPSDFQFFFRQGASTFTGASPEMLLQVTDGLLETHPIAGTRSRGEDEATDERRARELQDSVKECSEHLMLVDLARNDIGRIALPGTVTVAEFQVLKKFTSVMHLVSRVQGRLPKDGSPLAALAACFPAGTLSGAPKVRAMEILAEREPVPRGFYGGAVIAASFSGDLESCISIRSAEVKADEIIFQAGAGVVADSVPRHEYLEVKHKTQALRRALGEILA